MCLIRQERNYRVRLSTSCLVTGVLTHGITLCFVLHPWGAYIDQSINVGGAPYVFKMNGAIYHRIGGTPYVFKMNGVVYHRVRPLLPPQDSLLNFHNYI